MGVMRRIADATRAKLDEWRDRKVVRIGDKALSELSDAELKIELERRRRARGHRSGSTSTSSSPRTRDGKAPGWKVRQWFRDLELEPGASRDQVEQAYQRLSKKYDPDKYDDDPEKHRAAVRLIVGLREAYDGLVEQHFDR